MTSPLCCVSYVMVRPRKRECQGQGPEFLDKPHSAPVAAGAAAVCVSFCLAQLSARRARPLQLRQITTERRSGESWPASYLLAELRRLLHFGAYYKLSTLYSDLTYYM